MPFAVALPLSITADLAVRAWARRAGAMSSEYPVPETVRLVPAHLWFLEYLFLFCAVTWAAVKVLEHRSGRPGRRPDAPGPPSRTWTLRFPAALLLLAVPTAVGLVLAPEPRPDLSFVPQAAVVAHHGLFFAAGFALYAARASLPALRPWWWLLPVGLGLAAFVFTRPLQWQPAGHALTGLVAWLATLGALGLALRLEPGERPWLRLLVDASYWVYLVHYPLVVALQVLLSPLSWPALLKYAVVVLATLGLTLGSFVAFVRRSPLAPWLGVRGAKT
jgi:glucan biosynthesis protein C